MQLQTSSISKYRDRSLPGDDVVVAIAHRLYAVFDGATDTVQVNGGSAGQFAAVQAAAAMVACCCAAERGLLTPTDWIARMNASVATGLAAAGVPQARACTTAAVVEDAGDSYRFLVVGDSGIRINGTQVLGCGKDIDRIFTTARLAIYAQLHTQGLRGDALERVTRQLVVMGLAQAEQTWLDAASVRQIVAHTQASCATFLGTVAQACVAPAVLAGIKGGQYSFENLPNHPLGYAAITGGTTAGPDIQVLTLPKSQVHSIELYTDGYMSLPQGCTVADWEAEFWRVEEVDYAKTGAYPGIKGSTTEAFSDDRSVVCVQFAS